VYLAVLQVPPRLHSLASVGSNLIAGTRETHRNTRRATRVYEGGTSAGRSSPTRDPQQVPGRSATISYTGKPEGAGPSHALCDERYTMTCCAELVMFSNPPPTATKVQSLHSHTAHVSSSFSCMQVDGGKMIARTYLNVHHGEAEGRRSWCYLFPRARRPNHMQQRGVLAEHVTRWNVVRQACC
jgi:hypothetical protein